MDKCAEMKILDFLLGGVSQPFGGVAAAVALDIYIYIYIIG